MSALVFDKSGDRYFEAGVENVALFVKGSSGDTVGNAGYKAGVVWNGCTSLTVSPEGAEANDLWADNRKYASLYSTETVGGSIEAYTYPDEFAECDGSANCGVAGLSIGQQSRKSFALVWKTKVGNDEDTDLSNIKLHFLYGLMATPSEKAYETINDSPDAITFSWDFNSTAVKVGVINGVEYKDTSYICIDQSKLDSTSKANFATLLEKVYGKDPTSEGTADGLTPTMLTPKEIYNTLSGTTT